MDPTYALHQMTSRKDMVEASYKVKNYVMYDLYECVIKLLCYVKTLIMTIHVNYTYDF